MDSKQEINRVKELEKFKAELRFTFDPDNPSHIRKAEQYMRGSKVDVDVIDQIFTDELEGTDNSQVEFALRRTWQAVRKLFI